MAYTAINDPQVYFRLVLYTGNGSGSGQDITFDTTDTSMQPDLVWIKTRNDGNDHNVFDSVRGAQKLLETNTNLAEQSPTNALSAFNSNGFSFNGDHGQMNGVSDTNVAWCWKESATAGFDIVSYTGNDTARTISHSLSAVPRLYIARNTEEARNWGVYHQALVDVQGDAGYRLVLNTTGAGYDDATYFNNTAPTSSVFSVGTNNGTNEDTKAHIAYLFAEKQGFSKFGGYTGNGNADGPFVYTGFRPAFVMVKNTDETESWIIFDNKRPGYNLTDALLKPNLTNVESSSEVKFDLLSNGFKARVSDAEGNSSGDEFIYVAFAEAPLVNSEGVPGNAW